MKELKERIEEVVAAVKGYDEDDGDVRLYRALAELNPCVVTLKGLSSWERNAVKAAKAFVKAETNKAAGAAIASLKAL